MTTESTTTPQEQEQKLAASKAPAAKEATPHPSVAIHQQVVDQVSEKLSPDDVLFDMAEMFKAMSDPTRLKIINALMASELCVADITALLSMTQPAVSHHLKALRQARLIKFRRDGKSAYYSLDDDHIELLFKQCETHVWEER